MSNAELNDRMLEKPTPGEARDVIAQPFSREEFVGRDNNRSSRFGLAVAASILVHLSIAWAGFQYASEDVLGGADVEIETISVEIVGAIPRAASTDQAAQPESGSGDTEPAARPLPLETVKPDQDQQPSKEVKPVLEEPVEEKRIAKAAPIAPSKREPLAIPEDFPSALPRPIPPKTQPTEHEDSARLPNKPTVNPEQAPRVEDFPTELPALQDEQPDEPAETAKQEATSAERQRIDTVERDKPPADRSPDPKTSDVSEKPTKPEQEVKRPARKQTKEASRASRASAQANQSSSARQKKVVSASKGALRIFARRIARALARSRPRRLAATGTVMIAFTLSQSGALSSVRVQRSSGISRIDRAALRAVRRARFPRPPAGATRKQRSFVVPYHFRRR